MMILSQAATQIFLETGWQMLLTPAGSYSLPSAAAPAFADSLPVSLPCTAASALRAAGQFAFGKYALDDLDIWFRCELNLPVDASFLHFDGLAGIADVYWNDTPILRSENMFVAHQLDLRALNICGQGQLSLCFTALNQALTARRPRPRWKTRLVEQQQLRWIRTSLLGRMPGWSPPVPPVGPYLPVRLETGSAPRLLQKFLHSRLMGNDGVVDARFLFEQTSPYPLTQARLHIGERTQDLHISRDTDGNTCVSGELLITTPQRWWPHTHGTPHRYPVFLEITCDDIRHLFNLGQTGFRHIHAVVDNDDFHLHVNDVPVFCRGACWMPADVFTLNADENTQRQMLTLARDAGMNMLRVVGTMCYENQAFYQLCDELGILVWQDFMFANMDYPVADLQFADSILRESREFLERTQGSPCIAILCGNSEVEQQAAMLGQAKENWSNPFFQDSLPQLCHDLRPDALYWPSSPSGGVMPFQVDAGIAHYFGVGAYLRPLDDARRSGVKFTSECLGFSNMPEDSLLDSMHQQGDFPGLHPSWKQRVPRDHGTGWDFEDVRDHYMHQLYGVDPARLRYAERERYIALARTTTGEVMAQTLREWRRHGSACHGALIWFWRDLWAGAGWGVIDAHGKPKAAYYYLKRVMAPLTVLITDEGLNGLELHVINDTPEPFEGRLQFQLLRDGETVVADVSQPISLPAQSSMSVRTDSLLPYFMDTSYAYRFGPPGHQLALAHIYRSQATYACASNVHFIQTQALAMERDPGITAVCHQDEAGHYLLSLETQRFVQALAISVNGYLPEDNYFHLAPGHKRTIRLQCHQTQAAPKISLRALNISGTIKVSYS